MDLRSKFTGNVFRKPLPRTKTLLNKVFADFFLAAKIELFDNRSIALNICLGEVLQNPTTLTNHQ